MEETDVRMLRHMQRHEACAHLQTRTGTRDSAPTLTLLPRSRFAPAFFPPTVSHPLLAPTLSR
eukprot:1101148-Pleurochrysis_carterae.AAC.2